jgi:hypothetical protein
LKFTATAGLKVAATASAGFEVWLDIANHHTETAAFHPGFYDAHTGPATTVRLEGYRSPLAASISVKIVTQNAAAIFAA